MNAQNTQEFSFSFRKPLFKNWILQTCVWRKEIWFPNKEFGPKLGLIVQSCENHFSLITLLYSIFHVQAFAIPLKFNHFSKGCLYRYKWKHQNSTNSHNFIWIQNISNIDTMNWNNKFKFDDAKKIFGKYVFIIESQYSSQLKKHITLQP